MYGVPRTRVSFGVLLSRDFSRVPRMEIACSQVIAVLQTLTQLQDLLLSNVNKKASRNE